MFSCLVLFMRFLQCMPICWNGRVSEGDIFKKNRIFFSRTRKSNRPTLFVNMGKMLGFLLLAMSASGFSQSCLLSKRLWWTWTNYFAFVPDSKRCEIQPGLSCQEDDWTCGRKWFLRNSFMWRAALVTALTCNVLPRWGTGLSSLYLQTLAFSWAISGDFKSRVCRSLSFLALGAEWSS